MTAMLSRAPAQIDAHFAEDIVKHQGTYGLSVTDGAGHQVDSQDAVLDDADRRRLTVTLQGGLGAGSLQRALVDRVRRGR